MYSINKIQKLYGIAGALIVLAFPYFILHYNNGHIETSQSFCPFMMITGFPCPGCGITKSLMFLYEGDLLKSLSYHIFGPFAFISCTVLIIVLIAELLTNKEYFRKILYNQRLAYFLGATLAIYHLTRIIFYISVNRFDDILKQSIWR